MTGRNAKAFEVAADDHAGLHQAGAYQFWGDDLSDPDGIHIGCPCGCGAIYGANFGPEGWTIAGEWPNASLSPSLGMGPNTSGGHHWHGYLRNGVFEEC